MCIRDSFTKHLTGKERVEKLLKIFGCNYSDGRSEIAPTLREGRGMEKGELLQATQHHHEPRLRWADVEPAEEKDMIRWQGKWFPRAFDNEGNPTEVAEAYPTHNNLLPHLHTSIHDHFPSASACPALCEDDVPEDITLEEVGAADSNW